jgi:hypothetical protein
LINQNSYVLRQSVPMLLINYILIRSQVTIFHIVHQNWQQHVIIDVNYFKLLLDFPNIFHLFWKNYIRWSSLKGGATWKNYTRHQWDVLFLVTCDSQEQDLNCAVYTWVSFRERINFNIWNLKVTIRTLSI